MAVNYQGNDETAGIAGTLDNYTADNALAGGATAGAVAGTAATAGTMTHAGTAATMGATGATGAGVADQVGSSLQGEHRATAGVNPRT
ncbi:MAG TPA: hypothetical protein VD969_03870 [Symbiobacteriaceae bacterium]|nr:hypothetical protein [Symbiobacteriaceae bacterium]